MRQKFRRGIGYLALLIFPITMNYFSPYLSVTAAIDGIVAGSIFTFALMFLTGIIFGRSWCAWVCPVAGLNELTNSLNYKMVKRRKLALVRYSIFTIWFGSIIIFFILNGGIRSVEPLFMTDLIVSIDMPVKYITYYMVLVIFILPNLIIGRRASCHSLCWMAPFLEAGYFIGRILKIKQLRVIAEKEKCIKCERCNRVCPMSIDVMEDVGSGVIVTKDCILCGECIDTCPKDVLNYGIKKKR